MAVSCSWLASPGDSAQQRGDVNGGGSTAAVRAGTVSGAPFNSEQRMPGQSLVA